MATPKYLWLDFETTGLDPAKGCLLEVFAVATGSDLRPIDDGYHALIQPWAVFPMDDYVRKMHTENGLLRELQEIGGRDADTVCDELEHYLYRHFGGVKGRAILAGASVHFDHAWLAFHLQRLNYLFSHRHYDVSVLKMVAQDAGDMWTKTTAHRSKDDVFASMDDARMCINWLTHSQEAERYSNDLTFVPEDAGIAATEKAMNDDASRGSSS
jgi:oligoribonuclease (3'-5' exoribonuclease)